MLDKTLQGTRKQGKAGTNDLVLRNFTVKTETRVREGAGRNERVHILGTEDPAGILAHLE